MTQKVRPFGVDRLHAMRFAQDVAVSGTADYRFETQAIDASVTVQGPGAEDGRLHVTGVWFSDDRAQH